MKTFDGFVLRSKLSPEYYYTNLIGDHLTKIIDDACLFTNSDQVPDTIMYKSWEPIKVHRVINTIELDIL